MAKVQGYCEERFDKLRSLMETNVESGEELGASIGVEINGKLLVDLWVGYRDEAKSQPWEANTVVNLWSTTKTIGSLSILVAVDRGFLELDEKVCKYWPEFAQNGKEAVTVRQIISHTSGVPAWEKPMSIEDVYDLKKANAKLAAQPPWWEPGTAMGYHMVNHGHLISELLYRTTGKYLKQFVAEELAKPLDADFQVGLAEQDYSRAATIIPPPTVEMPVPPPDSVMEKAWGAPKTDAQVANSTGWRKAEIGATNGHGNGRSIARMLSPLAVGGTVNGTKFLSQKTIDQVFQEQAFGNDLVVAFKMRMGTGFGLPAKGTYWDWLPEDSHIFGWGGWGGSLGVVDMDKRMTIGYGMNKMHQVGLGSECTKQYVAEIYRVLGAQS